METRRSGQIHAGRGIEAARTWARLHLKSAYMSQSEVDWRVDFRLVFSSERREERVRSVALVILSLARYSTIPYCPLSLEKKKLLSLSRLLILIQTKDNFIFFLTSIFTPLAPRRYPPGLFSASHSPRCQSFSRRSHQLRTPPILSSFTFALTQWSKRPSTTTA